MRANSRTCSAAVTRSRATSPPAGWGPASATARAAAGLPRLLLVAHEPAPHLVGALAVRLAHEVALGEDGGGAPALAHEEEPEDALGEARHDRHQAREVEQPLDRARDPRPLVGPVGEGAEQDEARPVREVRAPRALPIEVGVLERALDLRPGVARHRRAALALAGEVAELVPHARALAALAGDGREGEARLALLRALAGGQGLRGGGDRLARSLRRGEQRHGEGARLGRERAVAQRHALAPREPLALGAGLALGVGEERARGAVLGRVAHGALREGEGEARVALVPRGLGLLHGVLELGAVPALLRLVDARDDRRRLGRLRVLLDELLPVAQRLALGEGEGVVGVLGDDHVDERLG